MRIKKFKSYIYIIDFKIIDVILALTWFTTFWSYFSRMFNGTRLLGAAQLELRLSKLFTQFCFQLLICISELFSRIIGARHLWGRQQGICKAWLGTAPYVFLTEAKKIEVCICSITLPFTYSNRSINFERFSPN